MKESPNEIQKICPMFDIAHSSFGPSSSIKNVGKAKKNNSKTMAELNVKMAKPRVAASVRADANVFSYFKGVFVRVARRLGVSASMVSRVASGHRSSPKIQAALLEELKVLKQILNSVSD